MQLGEVDLSQDAAALWAEAGNPISFGVFPRRIAGVLWARRFNGYLGEADIEAEGDQETLVIGSGPEQSMVTKHLVLPPGHLGVYRHDCVHYLSENYKRYGP